MNESDENYRNRILEKVPAGAWYTAEDLGNASGADLDAIGETYGVTRPSPPIGTGDDK